MPHGHCFFWEPDILWLHVVSDSLIVASYYSIPLTLLYFLKKRPGLRLNGLIVMFGGFILACGTTHLISIWDLWHSAYRLEGLVKAITAALSVATAIVTLKLVPEAAKIAMPEEAANMNLALQQEIEARKEAEKKLLQHLESERQAGEARLRAYFEAAPEAILAMSADGRMRLVNRQTEETFGYDRSELLGQPLEKLIPARFRGAYSAGRPGFFDHPVPRKFHGDLGLAGLHRDGSEFPVEISLNFLEDPGNPMALALVTDITRRTRARAELSRLNVELVQANADLQQFVGSASHDLQEPLRMVISYLQLLERRAKDALDETSREFLHFAVDGAARMRTLIQDLLRLSRSGTQPADFRQVSIEQPVSAALANLKIAIEEAQARVTVNPLPNLVVDAGLLTQVFQNLIGNAIKFCAPGVSPQVSVSAETSGAEWDVSVRDNGIGIPPEYTERIFGLFERLQSAEKVSGSGVGLTIAKKIVERHRGRIWVESTPGGGSVFHFTLPGKR
ncbi:MAG TPA: ATP-binding protein, partial [Bryobacteraceae bacterium]